MSKEVYSKSVSRSKDEATASDCYDIRDGVLVKYIGKDRDIVIPKSVKHIGNEAFSGSLSLRSAVIPNSVEDIGDEAFALCSKLKAVTIADSVSHIGHYAFAGCKKLKSFYYRGTREQWLKISKGSN